MEVCQERLGSVRETYQVNAVGLIEHQFVTMCVCRGVRGNVGYSTALQYYSG